MVTKDGSNGFDPEQLERYLDEIDKADDQLLSLKSEHMQKCKGPRGRIRETMKSAKEAGLNMSALRTIVAEHRSKRKIEEKIAALEADDQADYEAMREALGGLADMPLGEAALNKTRPQGEQLDSLRG